MINSKTITTKELRDNLSEILEQVDIGNKSYVVSKFGKKKAAIVPLREDRKKKTDLKKLDAYGMWEDREDMEDVDKWVKDLRTKESRRSLDDKK